MTNSEYRAIGLYAFSDELEKIALPAVSAGTIRKFFASNPMAARMAVGSGVGATVGGASGFMRGASGEHGSLGNAIAHGTAGMLGGGVLGAGAGYGASKFINPNAKLFKPKTDGVAKTVKSAPKAGQVPPAPIAGGSPKLLPQHATPSVLPPAHDSSSYASTVLPPPPGTPLGTVGGRPITSVSDINPFVHPVGGVQNLPAVSKRPAGPIILPKPDRRAPPTLPRTPEDYSLRAVRVGK